jgi:cellulose synthase/poly-beta-1,6-N-acetylglucosamine synthase-like glycosyltransferase
MKLKWKRILFGDKREKEFTLILLIALCSMWLGAMIFMLDQQLKNLLLIAGQINPEEIILYAPLTSLKMNAMVLWDIALIIILVAYLVGLVAVFYYTKGRVTNEGEK